MIFFIRSDFLNRFLFFILILFLGNSFLFSNDDNREKVAIIIPGRGEYPDNPAYQGIKQYFVQQDYTTYILDLDWDEISLENIISKGEEALAPIFTKHDQDDIILFGFSFGAVIALKNSNHKEVKKTILASLSSIFEEDLPYHTALFRFIINKTTDFNNNNLNYQEVLENPICFFYGSKDSLIINDEIIDMRNRIFLNSELILVEGARHDISGENYQMAIQSYIKTLK